MKVSFNLKYGQIHTKSGEHEQKMFDFICIFSIFEDFLDKKKNENDWGNRGSIDVTSE